MTIEHLRQQLEDFTRHRRPGGVWESPPGLRFSCIEDLVLQFGTTFRRSSEPPPIRRVPRACYYQSYRLATRKASPWIYCEGYAVSPNSLGLHVLHAWVTRAEVPGEAHDLAWEEGTSENTAYIGIPFRPKFVRETHLSSHEELYCVLDNWWLNYPLLTGETRIEDVIWK